VPHWGSSGATTPQQQSFHSSRVLNLGQRTPTARIVSFQQAIARCGVFLARGCKTTGTLHRSRFLEKPIMLHMPRTGLLW
jgi:hypothetical protein